MERDASSAHLLAPAVHSALAAQVGSAPEESPTPLYVVDPQGLVAFCNRAFARLVGAPVDQLVGKPSLLLYPADATPALLMERVNAFLGHAAPRKVRIRMRRRGGETVPVELEVSPLVHAGRTAGLAVAARPVAEEKKRPNVEYLLRLTPQEADALPYGLIMLDASGLVIAYNDTESRLSRLDRERVLGRNFFREIAPCTGVRDFEGLYRQMVRTGAPASAQFDFLFRFRHGDQAVTITMAYFPQLAQGVLLVDPKSAG
jgi:photoactive yellow protein